jgi:hypothetical protein|tara:strand:- start:292 stop:558 length:267 start_codon:yes stop_codon:yes gene_type:complete
MLREIKHILGRGDILIVEFTKKNGEKRKMKCTTSLDRIPDSEHPQEGSTFTYNTEKSLRVYDIEAEGWRSFRVDSVDAIESAAFAKEL